jgi:hypothetical protein
MSYRSILSFIGPDRHCAARTQFGPAGPGSRLSSGRAAPTGLLQLSATIGLEQRTSMADLGQKVRDADAAGRAPAVEGFRGLVGRPT